LKIAKLLDVEDLLSVARPDERSVMTYISLFFHAFAAQDYKETAARRIQKFVQFHQNIDEMKRQYEHNTKLILQWVNDTCKALNDRTFDNSLDHAKALLEAHKVHKLQTKPTKNAERLEIEALFTNIQTKLKVNNRVQYTPPNGLGVADIAHAWNALGIKESERGKALRDNIGRLKEFLRVNFAERANKLYEWIIHLKDAVVAPAGGDLQSQLNFLHSKAAEALNNPRIKELEELHRQSEAAGIDENPHTEYSFEELTLLWDQLNTTISRKAQFIEGQILSQKKKGVAPEVIKEFNETFKHFDKDASYSLDRLEFKACLGALGVPFKDDAAYDLVFKEVSKGSEEITFDNFVDYMVKITEDTDTAEQLKQSFRLLANDQGTIGKNELSVPPLQPSEIDYVIKYTPQDGGRLKYTALIDQTFSM